MLVLFASTGTLLLVNLICACVALAVGFAAGVWFFGTTSSSQANSSENKTEVDEATVQANERAVMASSRLKDLASGIASDVHSHSEIVGELNDTLHAVGDQEGGEIDVAVFEAIAKMVEANSGLQERLALAEKQVEAQAAEIQTRETEARTDSLTQLANRRAFDDDLQRRYSEWERKQTPVSLLTMDIDHFKKFNDTHGHQAGDEVLRDVGRRLKDATRTMDIPCRYGGEEFAVIMPATQAKDATVVAERIRTAIEDSVINFEGKVLKVTTSVGLAEVDSQDDIKRLMKRSDDALYMSKEAGRNCGHLHVNDECVPITPGMDVPEASAKSETDALDGLPDDKMFSDELTRRVAESHRFGVPLSVMYLEVEQYQEINKDFGQVAAQMTLSSVAQFIASTLRDMDLLARSGDGAFLVMLPGSSKLEATQIGRRIEASMANCVIPAGKKKIRLSLRYGITATETKDTSKTIVGRAMAAMVKGTPSEAAAKV